MTVYWVNYLIRFHVKVTFNLITFILLCIKGSNEIIGRALVGNDRSLPQANRAIFDDLLRSKSATATAQWVSLTDPAIQ